MCKVSFQSIRFLRFLVVETEEEEQQQEGENEE